MIKDKILENFSNKHAYSDKIDEVSLENTAGSGLFRAGQAGGPKKCFFGHFLLTFQPFSVIIVFIEKPNKELEIYVSNIIIRGQKPMSIIKKEAKKLIDKLPEQATWDDIMYEFYVKKKLAVALKAADEGCVIPHKEVKKRLLSK
ncbi:MAG TPA: hypothetical protein VMW72_07420 [Sedimentisphaerales bacterium]|nr:hypothetical protein [Sedimentisphaerales bacterium]